MSRSGFNVFSMFIVVVIAVIASSNPTAHGQELPGVFNGDDLAGWKIPEGNIWFAANDGVLDVKSGPKQKGAILWTEKDYSDFVMQFEFKMGEGTVDTGIFIRNETDQIQIGISGSLKRDMTASPYVAKKGYPVEAEGVQELLRSDDWNKMLIVAVGGHYQVWLNGKPVMSYSSETASESGPIGIQLHAKKQMACSYREIRLAELP